MTLKEELKLEIEKGKSGKNSGIPVGYKRVQEFIDIDRHTIYTVGGETGAGKSTLCQDMFIIKPIQWYLANKHIEEVKLSIIYFGMEGTRTMSTARWISRLIFEEQGILIPSKKILGKFKKEGKKVLMTPMEEKLVDNYADRLDEWERDDLLIYYSGSKNPTGISRYLEAFARKHGTLVDKEKKEHKAVKDMTQEEVDNILDTKTYTPTHPNHIVLIITDHISILAPEREDGAGKIKMNIDKFSRTMREAKDLYGFSPVIVQQLNRNMSDVQRQKMGDLKPKLSDFADSSATSHDSEIVIAVHDPYRHGDIKIDLGYDITKLKDETGDTYYRALCLLKSRYGTSNIAIQMAMHPQTGTLKALPRSSQITEDLYKQVTTGMYFLD